MENDRKWLDDIRAEVEEERKNYTGPFCCLTMDSALKEPLEFILFYDPTYREYEVRTKNHAGFSLKYCSFCGKKLPKSLHREMDMVLEQEYGLDTSLGIKKKNMPPEFLTDEWWKKRGL